MHCDLPSDHRIPWFFCWLLQLKTYGLRLPFRYDGDDRHGGHRDGQDDDRRELRGDYRDGGRRVRVLLHRQILV